MKKILYLMHIPWRWVKQRPHFIAENLYKHYDTDVYYLQGFNTKAFTNEPSPNYVNSIFRLPLMKSKVSKFLNPYVIKYQLKQIINKYEYVWLTDPILYDYIKDIIPSNVIVVYDCMDDHLQFPDVISSEDKRRYVFNLEKKLITRANKIIVSSVYLKNTLSRRYDSFDSIVINNAIKALPSVDRNIDLHSEYSISRHMKIITYIGTISEWFDFNLILKSLKDNDSILYLLVGPTDQPILQHDRIKYIGPVDHEKIFSIMSASNALVMPFILNELILSVNPVKVYEYIYSGKPSIIVNYGETAKFKDYVYLYNNYNDYNNYMKLLSSNKLVNKTNKDDYTKYAQINTWEYRSKEINQYLDEANEK
jgi:hypothetical protein